MAENECRDGDAPEPKRQPSYAGGEGPERMRAWATRVVAAAEFAYQPRRGDVPGYILMDARTQEVIEAIRGGAGGVEGFALLPRSVPAFQEKLLSLEKRIGPHNEPAAANLARLRETVERAFGEHPQGGVAFATRDPCLQAEVQIYVTQTEIGGGRIFEHADLECLSNEQEMETFSVNLERIGYDSNQRKLLALTAAAHIMAGTKGTAGGTSEERRSFLVKYFRAVASRHGVKALSRFDKLAVQEARTILAQVTAELKQCEPQPSKATPKTKGANAATACSTDAQTSAAPDAARMRHMKDWGPEELRLLKRNFSRLASAYLSKSKPEEQEAAVLAELKKIEAERAALTPPADPSGRPKSAGHVPAPAAAAPVMGAPNINRSPVEQELKAYAAELHSRLSRAQAGPDNFICEPILNCEVIGQAEALPLIGWMQFNPFGPTMCALFFVPVPGAEEGLLGYEMDNPIARERAAFGLVPTARAAQSLPTILASLLATDGHESCRLLGSLPTSVFHSENWPASGPLAPYIDGSQARILLRLGVRSMPHPDLRAACEYLRRYKGDPWARAAAELDEGLLRAVVRVDEEPSAFDLGLYNEWFDLVTDPAHVKSEWDSFGVAWQTALQGAQRK